MPVAVVLWSHDTDSTAVFSQEDSGVRRLALGSDPGVDVDACTLPQWSQLIISKIGLGCQDVIILSNEFQLRSTNASRTASGNA